MKKIHGLNNEGLLAQIAAMWLRMRGDPKVTAHVPQELGELLDEAALRTTVARPEPWNDDTPTETPASRRR
jgi:hypothetical protein